MSSIVVSTSAQLLLALANAKANDVIKLSAGTYANVTLSNLQLSGPVTITSADADNPAVIAGLTVSRSSNLSFSDVVFAAQQDSQPNQFVVANSSKIAFDGVEFRGANPIDANETALLIRWSQDVTVKNSEIHDFQFGVALQDTRGATISGNYFHDLRTDGVRGGGNSDIEISDNFFTSFHPSDGDHPDAIQFWTVNTTEAAENITVSGNVYLRGTGTPAQGVLFGDEVGTLPFKNVEVSDNLFVGGLFNGIHTLKVGTGVIADNVVVGLPDQRSWIVANRDGALTIVDNVASDFIGSGTLDASNVKLPTQSALGIATMITGWLASHDAGSVFPGSEMELLDLALATAIPQSIGESAFSLFLADDFAGAVSGGGTIFGTNGDQDVSLLLQAGNVRLDGSFARGGDTVRLTGDANDYTIQLQGSSAAVSNGTTSVIIPLGSVGLSLVFDDGARELRYDNAAGVAKIGNQTVSATGAAITATSQGTPAEADFTAGDQAGRLLLSSNKQVVVGGALAIFGTNGAEDVLFLDGNFTLDGSFARGGDTLHFLNSADSYSVHLSGSSLVLSDGESQAIIPIGISGLTLDFAGDTRILKYDTASRSVVVGDQAVSATGADHAIALLGDAIDHAAAALSGNNFL